MRPGSSGTSWRLDRHTFVLTHTELERRFLAIVRRAGLPLPTGQFRRGPHRMDFFWADPKQVVETDGLTYHRTLRFSHAQIRFEPGHVERTLAAVRRILTAVK